MKNLVLIFIVGFCLTQCKITSSYIGKDEPFKPCTIDYIEGTFNSKIKIGFSTVEDVVQEFGKGHLIEYRERVGEGFPYNEKFYKLEYNDRNLSFYFQKNSTDSILANSQKSHGYTKKKLDKFKLHRVFFNGTCDCKSKEGIGIGSTSSEIFNQLGEDKIMNSNKSKSIVYFKKEHVSFYSSSDSTNFVTSHILLSNIFR